MLRGRAFLDTNPQKKNVNISSVAHINCPIEKSVFSLLYSSYFIFLFFPKMHHFNRHSDHSSFLCSLITAFYSPLEVSFTYSHFLLILLTCSSRAPMPLSPHALITITVILIDHFSLTASLLSQAPHPVLTVFRVAPPVVHSSSSFSSAPSSIIVLSYKSFRSSQFLPSFPSSAFFKALP